MSHPPAYRKLGWRPKTLSSHVLVILSASAKAAASFMITYALAMTRTGRSRLERRYDSTKDGWD